MSARLAQERGFTTIELIVAMSITLILIFGVLMTFDTFNRNVTRTSNLTGAEDSARTTINRVVGVLRNAGAPTPVNGEQPPTVIRASGNDIVFRTTAWPAQSGVDPGGVHIGRLCLNSDTDILWFNGLRAGNPGPTDPGSACPAASATGWESIQMATKVLNTSTDPVFRYGSTNPVRTVGVSLRLEGGSRAETRPLTMHSGGALRGALAPQVTPDDLPYECVEGGKALLTLDADAGGVSTDGVTLTADGAITAGPGKILVQASSTPTNVAVTVTNALGLQTLLFKQVSCP